MDISPQQEAAYAAATDDVACHDAARGGRLLFSGPDHLDFLHRMSTNHVAGLGVGQGLRTVFCDARGRIVDLAVLARTDGERTAAFVDAGRAAPLLDWLERYHFAERIEWEDRCQLDGELILLGPALPELARERLGLALDELEPCQVRATGGLYAQVTPLGASVALRLWGPAGEIAGLRDDLLAVGVAAVDAATWEVLRIEAGSPAAGGELSLEHNPWEAGLDDAVHQNKGCYIGQEVVARLDTYQKVKQRLVGLRLEGAVDAGQPVTAAGREIGVITSAAVSPRRGPLALGYLRRGHWEPDTAVAVGDVAATVAALPFGAAR